MSSDLQNVKGTSEDVRPVFIFYFSIVLTNITAKDNSEEERVYFSLHLFSSLREVIEVLLSWDSSMCQVEN